MKLRKSKEKVVILGILRINPLQNIGTKVKKFIAKSTGKNTESTIHMERRCPKIVAGSNATFTFKSRLHS